MEGTVLKDQNGYFTILGNNQVLTCLLYTSDAADE